MIVMEEAGGDGFTINPEHIRAVKREGRTITIDVGGGIGYTMTTEMTLEEFGKYWMECLTGT